MDRGRDKYRILSIDGGGIVGTFPAAFLAGLEQHLDRPIASYFDLIVGTSTGGIIAIGLAMGLSAKDVLELYEKRGPSIFGQDHGWIAIRILGFFRAVQHWLFRRKYGSEKLREALQDILGERRIGEAKTRLVVPAWNPVLRKVYVYKTAHHERLRTDYKDKAVDAALATSAAPTYFARHLTDNDVGLVDGGVWANNPIAIAAIEAVGVLKWPGQDLRILSVGCVQETYRVPKAAGILGLGAKLLKLIMDGQSHGSMGMAVLLTDHERPDKTIWRIDNTAPKGLYRLDDTGKIRELKGLGFARAREEFPGLLETFFRSPAEPFVSLYPLPAEAAP